MDSSLTSVLAFVLPGGAGVAMLFLLRLVKQLGSQLHLSASNEPGTRNAVLDAIFANEARLNDLGVHKVVWQIRGLFILAVICILGFTYLISMLGVA